MATSSLQPYPGLTPPTLLPERRDRADGPTLPPWVIVAAAVVAAPVIGALLAYNVRIGIAALVAVCYLPVALINLPLAIALWFPLIFISYVPGVKYADHGAAIVIGLAWLGTFRRGQPGTAALAQHRGIVAAVVALLGWVLASMAWAQKPVFGTSSEVIQFAAVTALFFIVATTACSRRHVRMFALAFVAGAAISAGLGVITNGLHAGATQAGSAAATAAATEQAGRIQGGAGDPNVLAAGLVPAVALALALLVGERRLMMRWLLGAATAMMLITFAATESRGGLVAAAVAILAALVVWKGASRRRIAVLCLLAATVVGVWFAATPGATQRLQNIIHDQGTGRQDIWIVGWRVARSHPIVGVGADNFTFVESQYVREPGNLEFVRLIVDVPHVAHNTFLQILIEQGIIGLALFLVIMTGCLRASRRAAERFDLVGDRAMGDLSRSVLVGAIGLLAASFFFTNSTDSRLWMLFALSPVLLALARRRIPSVVAARSELPSSRLAWYEANGVA